MLCCHSSDILELCPEPQELQDERPGLRNLSHQSSHLRLQRFTLSHQSFTLSHQSFTLSHQGCNICETCLPYLGVRVTVFDGDLTEMIAGALRSQPRKREFCLVTFRRAQKHENAPRACVLRACVRVEHTGGLQQPPTSVRGVKRKRRI